MINICVLYDYYYGLGGVLGAVVPEDRGVGDAKQDRGDVRDPDRLGIGSGFMGTCCNVWQHVRTYRWP